MFERVALQDLDDFFVEISRRRSKGVYFYRINGYSEYIDEFIRKYYEAARKSGVIIEGRIANPTESNLSYFQEIMGMNFKMDIGFITVNLKKWLPRMTDYQRSSVASAMYGVFEGLLASGKNENMIKNAYVKFMCWLYYKFERIVSRLGDNVAPKILYEGDISRYELLMLSVLSRSGCDIVILQYKGDENYLKSDPTSELSDILNIKGLSAFPQSFNLKTLREEMVRKTKVDRMYGEKPDKINCTNAWLGGNIFFDIKKAVKDRGSDQRFFYNCFCRVNGAEDKNTYINDLYQLQLELKNAGRHIAISEDSIGIPLPDEIAKISRGSYANAEQLIQGLSANIDYSGDQELKRLMKKAFIDIMFEEAENENININKLMNKAVYIICWLRRYQKQLFINWKFPDVGVFIYLGGCKTDYEALFLRMLSRLPVDVLILVPNLNVKCCLEDKFLYEINYQETINISKFPHESGDVRIGTAAYHAERDLDTLLYQDTGIYRNQQFSRANTVTLQTMYEEIAILWKEEVKYRPSFSTVDDIVNIPVIFSKVSGVKDGNVSAYWSSVKELITEDTVLIDKAPYITSVNPNPVKAFAVEFFKNGRVQKNKIKANKNYRYGHLREETQEYLLDKLQLFIDRKVIKGTFVNGTEYTIISTALNINNEILRLIQKFDFTKKNPKIIYINTSEKTISLEDSILMGYLNTVGFDVVFFVPTGYQTVEKYFNDKIIEEFQIGEYVYDMNVPDLNKFSSSSGKGLINRIFKRGM
ncbi:MAG: hypothetical protein HFE90_10420 [Firmicutes bacterium]|nr:hypothetical protein [Bacillota bacterium]